jgi:hypothetical protein
LIARPARRSSAVKFAVDSFLEEAGFEPSGADLFEVNGTKITGVRERSSRFRQG